MKKIFYSFILVITIYSIALGNFIVWRWDDKIYATKKNDGIYLSDLKTERIVYKFNKNELIFNIAPYDRGIFLTMLDENNVSSHYKIAFIDTIQIQKIKGWENNSQYFSHGKDTLTTIRSGKKAILKLNNISIDTAIVYLKIQISSDGKYCFASDAYIRIHVYNTETGKKIAELTNREFSEGFSYLNNIIYYIKNDRNAEKDKERRVVAFDLEANTYCCEKEIFGKKSLPKIYYRSNTLVW